MAQREPRLSDRIASFLRRRGEPASSLMLAGLFLRTSAGSEELATKLLRPALTEAGATYTEGVGWVVPAGECPPARLVAAAVDRAVGRVVSDSALEDATAVLLDPRADAAWLRDCLRRRGLPLPASIISLRTALRGASRIPRGAGLAEICAALGVRWLDSEDVEGAVRAMASCLTRAAARREGAGGRGPGGEGRAPLPAGITPQDLAALPEAPGVYRFYDAQGELIYVGKAASLRRRVSSYFDAGAARRPRRFYHLIHRLEYEASASELEALLKEARLIRRRAPAGNVQVEIHERGPRFGSARAFAILLPRRGPGATAVFVRDGRYVGHARIGPKGGGLAAAGRLLARAVRAGERRETAAPADRDSRLLTSWLARHGESVSRVELDSFRKVSDAARALREAVRALPSEPGPTLFR